MFGYIYITKKLRHILPKLRCIFRSPLVFIFGSVAFTALCFVGMSQLRSENSLEELWLPSGSAFRENTFFLSQQRREDVADCRPQVI